MKYQRILLKISGEAFSDEDKRGIDAQALLDFSNELKPVYQSGVKIAIVVGGGNFWRERDFRDLKLKRTSSDKIGMMATMMNGLILKAFFETQDIKSEVFSAKNALGAIDEFTSLKALKSMEENNIAILTGGTGHPFFTTDTAAALRALELDCDLFLKGTKVDGVFDKDPEKDSTALKFDKITFEEALEKNLKVLDQTAYALLLQKRTDLVVFNVFKKGNLEKIIKGENIGTLVY